MKDTFEICLLLIRDTRDFLSAKLNRHLRIWQFDKATFLSLEAISKEFSLLLKKVFAIGFPSINQSINQSINKTLFKESTHLTIRARPALAFVALTKTHINRIFIGSLITTDYDLISLKR